MMRFLVFVAVLGLSLLPGMAHAHDWQHLDEITRPVVQIAHFGAFPLGAWLMAVIAWKWGVIHKHIYSPTLLLLGLTCLMIAAAFEISNHHYVGAWELKDARADFINGMFYTFNFPGLVLLAVGMRQARFSWSSAPKWLNLIDLILLGSILITPMVYFGQGRSVAMVVSSIIAGVSGTVLAIRLYTTLGRPLCALAYFALSICGVIAGKIYLSTGIELLHAGIGGSFVASMIPIAHALGEPRSPFRGIAGRFGQTQGISRLSSRPA